MFGLISEITEFPARQVQNNVRFPNGFQIAMAIGRVLILYNGTTLTEECQKWAVNM